MQPAPLLKKIEEIIAPTAASMGYDIVRVLLVGAGSGKATLQIMAEKPDGTMDVEDCARLSQAVSALMDVEDVFDTAYYLEVSSPGIDRPLTRRKDFDAYKGFDARIECDEAIDTQKKFKGLLKGIDGDDIVTLATDKGDIAIPFARIEKAKLLLTEALLAAHAAGNKKTKDKETETSNTNGTTQKKDRKGR